ncbi:MAG TPA: methyltransferase domain-containing protein [Chthonomonadaceae bacterium]|nr:methyltransferase domain-containing protein [Chthonomonadaceae bacterium]
MTEEVARRADANANNPYHKTAESYEAKLRSPLVRPFREAEEKRLTQIFDALIRPEDTLLEIGCGTGYYTRTLVKRARHMVALDDSEAMLQLVCNRLPAEDQAKIEFVHSEATHYLPPEPFDIVLHLGVLDYVREWQKFLTHSITHARRAVIFTCPTTGFFGQTFHYLSLFRGIHVMRFRREQIENFLREGYPDWQLDMERVGINSGWTGGMTWVATLRKREPET